MRIVRSLEELLELPRDRCVKGMGPREPLPLEIPNPRRCDPMRTRLRFPRVQSRSLVPRLGALAIGFLARLLTLRDALAVCARLPQAISGALRPARDPQPTIRSRRQRNVRLHPMGR
ncbi:hypothetical protein [Methylacidimicrobium sp. B4]|uniref:hypothetical protein n=1 Tax=Methylacidimicrobium sp. B4 TaxID=2796139 RepID=UPI001A8C543F|nr:hypothetical protein [Methylacidimicrobium sp. B4]QSR85327.1 hypothetical protein MacB4_03500 [Methylacidimicrobium sp. B4]